ncbi:uncharacterized protein LOC131650519 [Vicia villosa]|uniref:uncharacterized protein LOC131650519 n=1 Tax=Vicia villosa TaxID=3911 RepID=UPI00273C88BE|nr:uncharacterized protein LOC131650519 [Vicia villosa]
MISAWKLKNPVETQELNKNLFLFRFATRRDLKNVIRSGPWSFDRNLLVLARVSGEEQPSSLNMHYGSFWVRVYELPLMLKTEAMAKKLGGILGVFEEVDQKDAHRNGRFLRIKVTLDRKLPLKRGTVVRFKEKNSKVFFKYERLPTFCFICGRLGHQLKDCEAVGELSEEGFEELEEQDLSYGVWLRASPLPRIPEEQKKKDSNSSSCSRSLFNISSDQSKCETKNKDKEEGEVNQVTTVVEGSKPREDSKVKEGPAPENRLEIEAVAESLGSVDISNVRSVTGKAPKNSMGRKKKWTRRVAPRKGNNSESKKLEMEMGKRQLIDVMIIEGDVEGCVSGEKKRKGLGVGEEKSVKEPEVVLDDQHRLAQ